MVDVIKHQFFLIFLIIFLIIFLFIFPAFLLLFFNVTFKRLFFAYFFIRFLNSILQILHPFYQDSKNLRRENLQNSCVKFGILRYVLWDFPTNLETHLHFISFVFKKFFFFYIFICFEYGSFITYFFFSLYFSFLISDKYVIL